VLSQSSLAADRARLREGLQGYLMPPTQADRLAVDPRSLRIAGESGR
jgi:hypothetical protein